MQLEGAIDASPVKLQILRCAQDDRVRKRINRSRRMKELETDNR